MKTSQDYIKDQIKKNDYVTWVSSYFQPRMIRADFLTMYWLNKELTRINFLTREKALGMGKLDFWEESISQAYEGYVNKEPICIAWADALRRSHLPKILILRIIAAHKQELEYPEFPDYMSMEDRAELKRTSLMLLHLKMMRMNFKDHPELLEAARFAGKSIGILSRTMFGHCRLHQVDSL